MNKWIPVGIMAILLVIAVPSAIAIPASIVLPENITYLRNTTFLLNWSVTPGSVTMYNAFYSLNGLANVSTIFPINRSLNTSETKANITIGDIGEDKSTMTTGKLAYLGNVPKDAIISYANITFKGWRNYNMINLTHNIDISAGPPPSPRSASVSRNTTNIFLMDNDYSRFVMIFDKNGVYVNYTDFSSLCETGMGIRSAYVNSTNWVLLVAGDVAGDRIEVLNNSMVSAFNISIETPAQTPNRASRMTVDNKDGIINFAYVFVPGTPGILREYNMHTGESTYNLSLPFDCTQITNGNSLTMIDGDNSTFWFSCNDRTMYHYTIDGTLLNNISVEDILVGSNADGVTGLDTLDGVQFLSSATLLPYDYIHNWSFTYPNGVTVDTGNNQSVDVEFLGNLSFGNESNINITAYQEQLTDCSTALCPVVINISSVYPGIVELSRIAIGYTMNTTFEVGYGVHRLEVFVNDTDNYMNSTVQYFTSAFGFYNLTIFDEMTEDYFDINDGGINETEFRAYCPSATEAINITTNPRNVSITCEFDQLELRVDWLTAGVLYRTLIPSFRTGELRFYMIDAENYSSNMQRIYVDDASGLYSEGDIRITKILSNGSQIMVEQNLDTAASIFAHLVLDELYIMSVIATGQPTRVIGTFRGTSDSTLTIKLPPLEIIPIENFQMRDVGWEFRPNGTASTIQLIYNDTLNATTSINFTLYNASQLTQVISTSTVIPSSKVTTITLTVPDNESTYQATFVAQHSTLGVIEDSFTVSFLRRIITLPGLPEKWYNIIGLAFIILLALIFGSFHAGAGALVTALGGGVMYFFGFIDSVVGFGVIMLAILLAGLAVIGNRRNE